MTIADRRPAGVQLTDAGPSDASDDPVAEAVRAAASAQRDAGARHSQVSHVDSEHEDFWQALGSRLTHEAKSALSEIGRAEIAESNAYLAAATGEANAIAHVLRAYADYRTQPWLDNHGRPVEIPAVDIGDPVAGRAELMTRLAANEPLTRAATNADWIDPLINLASIVAMGAGPSLRLAGPAAALDGVELSTNAAESVFATTEGVAIQGGRAIDRGASYEIGVRNLYGDAPISQRQFRGFVDDKDVRGVADNTTLIGGNLTAIDAKYVDTWTSSLRNPASEIGSEPWAATEQQQMIRQARAYSTGFPGGVVYHTNSVDLATYYTNVFRKAGVTDFKFVITPATKLGKKMTKNSMERIFGEGAFETERQIPGTRPGEDNSARYISFDDPASIPKLFDSVVSKIKPPMVRSGGVVREGAKLKLPDGTWFFAVLFHDDLEGWQKQIEQGASALGRATARVLGSDVIVSDGRTYSLSSCKIEFD